MKVLAIKNINSEAGCLYYFRKYTGDAVIQLPASTFETPVSFSIETNPLGAKAVDVSVLRALDYPMIPIKNALKAFIYAEDDAGRLPL